MRVLVDALNIDEIAGAIEWMIANHNNYDSDKIHQKIIEEFGFKRYGKRVYDIYQNLLYKCVNSRNN